MKPAPGQTPGVYFSFYLRPLPLKLSKAGRCSTSTFESQGHLESTSVAEGRNSWVSAARWSKETPRGLKYVLKSRPEIPVLRGVHMPGSRGTGAADVSHAPLGSPCPSFSPSFQDTDTAGVTGIYSCTLSCSLCAGQPTSIDFFLQTLLGHLVLTILPSSYVLPRVLTLSGLSRRC